MNTYVVVDASEDNLDLIVRASDIETAIRYWQRYYGIAWGDNPQPTAVYEIGDLSGYIGPVDWGHESLRLVRGELRWMTP